MSDHIDTIREAVDADELSVGIKQIPGSTKVYLEADEDSPYYAALMGERAAEMEEFLAAYTDAIRELFEVHDEDDTLESCWEAGRVLAEHFDGATKAAKRELISPIGDERDDFSKWKVVKYEDIYETFPEKDALPDVDLDGSPSYLVMICKAADDAAEVRAVFDRVDYADITAIEAKTWRNARKMDELAVEAVAEAANTHGRDDWGRETMERRAEAVETVYRMCGEEPPAADRIHAALEETNGD